MENEHTPLHDEIVKRAERIWRERGRPQDCDLEIWLEAERQLATQAQSDSLADVPTAAETAVQEGPSTAEQRITRETAAESMVEYYISPPIPDAEAVKAALQSPERVKRRRPRTS